MSRIADGHGRYLGTPFHAGRSIRMGALHNGSVRIAPFNAGIMRAPLLRLSLFLQLK